VQVTHECYAARVATDVVIIGARRTPVGSFLGTLSSVPAPALGSTAIRAALADSGIGPQEVDEVLLGCVLTAGLGQAPARQAALGAGLPASVPCTTVNKVCGSSMQTVMLGASLIRAGAATRIVAGGMENMSAAPYLIRDGRRGLRLGHKQVLDHMFFDGLQDPDDGNMMGHFGEKTAERYGLTREQQDAFAVESVKRSLAAVEGGHFETEIAPVTVRGRRGEQLVEQDEEPFRCDLDKIPVLKPAFAKQGTITAASSSSISDGAAALVLTSSEDAATRGVEPLARIVSSQTHSQQPEWFTTANIESIRKLQQKIGWRSAEVDLYEINEAFACVTMVTMQALDLPHEKVNVNGGACALGHPIGATGSRLLVTLIHALRRRGLRRGIAAACIGGGESTAIAVEIPP